MALLVPMRRGVLVARLAETAQDLRQCQTLRGLAFAAGRGGMDAAPSATPTAATPFIADDADPFDALCRHLMVEDETAGLLVSCCRVLVMPDGGAVHHGYAARRYDLARLAAYDRPLLEMGRFCVHPDRRGQADILRLAWAALTALVAVTGAGMMFGCSSFAGTDAAPYRAGFALLQARHLAPARFMPGIRAPEVIALRDAAWPEPGQAPATHPATPPADTRAGLAALPPLLRSYLAMGGWVGDHAVIDRDLGTLHVFTGLETDRVPPARLRALLGPATAPAARQS